MPQYPGAAGSFTFVSSNSSGLQIESGEQVYVLGALAASATQLPINDSNVTFEAAPAGATESSISVNIQSGNKSEPVPLVCVEIRYNGAPGAGETIQIQEADTDADGFYITPAAAAYTVSAFNANNAARVDLSPTGGKFMRVLRTKGANAVGCTVKITRLR
jgi:hypothetical protein